METIRKYSDPNRARMAKAGLESVGIRVFLKNENFAETMPMHGSKMSEIELQVEKEEIKNALEILGPEAGDVVEVEKIARKLNRLFGISIIAAVIAGFCHSYSQGFDVNEVPSSIGIGFLVGMLAILIQVLINKLKAQPTGEGEQPR